MMVLDTNVLSELMRPSSPIADWSEHQRLDTLFTTSVSQAEILSGLETMPEGKRRDRLLAAASRLFSEYFRDRILPFDSAAARAFAGIAAARRRAGRPIGTFDAQIAAIALAARATVATRNIRDFEACGVSVVDPWSA